MSKGNVMSGLFWLLFAVIGCVIFIHEADLGGLQVSAKVLIGR
jgi:hypothetical protein